MEQRNVPSPRAGAPAPASTTHQVGDFEVATGGGIWVAAGGYPESDTNATLAICLEYLMPTTDRREYAFHESLGIHDEVEQLAADVDTYAAPFFQSIATIEAAAEVIRVGAVPGLRGGNELRR